MKETIDTTHSWYYNRTRAHSNEEMEELWDLERAPDRVGEASSQHCSQDIIQINLKNAHYSKNLNFWIRKLVYLSFNSTYVYVQNCRITNIERLFKRKITLISSYKNPSITYFKMGP